MEILTKDSSGVMFYSTFRKAGKHKKTACARKRLIPRRRKDYRGSKRNGSQQAGALFLCPKRTENKKPVKNEKRREQYGRSDRNIDGRAELRDSSETSYIRRYFRIGCRYMDYYGVSGSFVCHISKKS